MPSSELHHRLSEPARLRALTQSIRAKVPSRDVEDIVQTTLADALAAAEPPLDLATFDRWLFGIARHKIADFYRRNGRDVILDSDDLADNQAEANPQSARDLLHWVNGELPKEPDAPRTLEWMLREASGDQLESIAKEHQLAAPTVRQRISRLRRHLRTRWAAAAALSLLIIIGYRLLRPQHSQPIIQPEVAQRDPLIRARDIRSSALATCHSGMWERCVKELDRAKALDPTGDTTEEVQQARLGAARVLHPPAPLPLPEPTESFSAKRPAPAPSSSAPRRRAPKTTTSGSLK